MPKGKYKRTEKQREHARTINIGRTPWNKGLKGIYKCSEETKKKISLANQGKNNNRWNGGKSQYYLRTKEEIAGRKRPHNCEICGRIGIIAFDHCHKTGEFRGWICNRCNLALGLVNDDIQILDGLKNYVIKHLQRHNRDKKDIQPDKED